MLFLDYVVVIVYLLGILAVGVSTARDVKTLNDFSVSNRNFSAVIIFATLSASFIGGGYTMGNAEKVYQWGIIYIVALWGFSIKEMMVAKWIVPRIDQSPDKISVGDIMQEAYGKSSKVVTGLFSTLLCAGIVGAQVSAVGYVFNLFLNVHYALGALIGFGIVIIYTTIGGIRAVVLTDIFQLIILGVGLPLTLIYGIYYVGGIETIINTVPHDHLSLFGHLSFISALSLFFVFFLGEALIPPYIQRLLIGRNLDHIKRGVFWSGLLSIPFFAIVGCIGLVALTMDTTINPNLAIPYVVQEILPVGIKGLVVAGIIAIVMSSADSFLNSAAVAICRDIIEPLKREPLRPEQSLKIARVATVATGLIAMVFALSIDSVLEILIYAYTFWAPIILVPLVGAIYGIKTKPQTFYISAGAGAVGFIIWQQLFHSLTNVDALIVGFIANLSVFYLCVRLEKQSVAWSPSS